MVNKSGNAQIFKHILAQTYEGRYLLGAGIAIGLAKSSPICVGMGCSTAARAGLEHDNITNLSRNFILFFNFFGRVGSFGFGFGHAHLICITFWIRSCGLRIGQA